ELARGVPDVAQWRETLGGAGYDEVVTGALADLERLAVELAASEALAVPLRAALQAGDTALRDRARSDIARVGLTERDLCTAWHHLPRQRRGEIAEALRRIQPLASGVGYDSNRDTGAPSRLES